VQYPDTPDAKENGDMTTRDDLAAMMLAEAARREAAIAGGRHGRRRSFRPDADDRDYGPRYSPTWFGDATATAGGCWGYGWCTSSPTPA
jgi:hypothetical protein